VYFPIIVVTETKSYDTVHTLGLVTMN